MELINRKEKLEIEEKLNEHFGIPKLNFLLIKSGEDRIRGFTGSLSSDEIKKIAREVNVEILGLYLMKREKDGIRLSFDAPTFLNPEKNIAHIDDKQAAEWLKGQDITYSGELKGFVILKHKDDFLGCGKSSNGRITNFVPKERRIKS